MPAFQNHLGINITNSKLQLVEVNYSGEEFALENIDEEYFPEFLDLNEKETKSVNILQSAFNELVMRRPVKSKYVSFTLPHECFKTVLLPYENSLIHNDLVEQFKWDVSLLFPKLPQNDLIVQYIKIEDFNKTDSYSAVVISTLRKYLKVLNTFCTQNELKLKYLDNVHIASDNIVALKNTVPGSDEYALSLYIVGNFVSVTLHYNNRIIYFNIIPVVNASEVLPKVSDEIQKNKFLKISPEKITRAFINGENISDSFIEKGRQALNLNFEKVNPFEEISVRPELFANKLFTDKAGSFTSAAGIAFRVV